MPKLLLAIDGSENSSRVVAALLRKLAWTTGPVELHLLNVQHPVHKDVGQFVDREGLKDFHRSEGLKALAASQHALEAADLKPTVHVVVDDQPAQTIMRFARDQAFDEILMGSHGHGAIARLLLGSVAADVARLSDVPVTLVK